MKLSKKRKVLFSLFLIPIILVVLAIVGIYALYYFSGDAGPYITKTEWLSENTPNSRLEELSWAQNPYKIFYKSSERDSEGRMAVQKIYSQMSNGTNKNLLYEQEKGDIYYYFLLNKTRQVLILSDPDIVLMNEDGSNQKVLYSPFHTGHSRTIRLSPDESKLAFSYSKNIYPQKDIIYILDINSGKVQQLSEKDLFVQDFTSMSVDNMYWFKDSNRLVIRTVNYIPTPTLSQVIVYEIQGNNSTLLGKYNHTNEGGDSGRTKLSKFVIIDDLSVPETRFYNEPYIYDTGIATSPDNKKVVKIKTANKMGKIFINEQEVYQWYRLHPYVSDFFNSSWLPDNNHLVLPSSQENGFRILETSTNKMALYPWGEYPKWFNMKIGDYKVIDW